MVAIDWIWQKRDEDDFYFECGKASPSKIDSRSHFNGNQCLGG
jgi:hypothetical protein